jgi:hypothetical protein
MEIWVPYGEVESLVTLMQENLGETVDPIPEPHLDEIVAPLVEKMRGAEKVFICDQKPATVKVVKALLVAVPRDNKRFFSSHPRKLEAAVPDLKGAVERLRAPGEGGAGTAAAAAATTMTTVTSAPTTVTTVSASASATEAASPSPAATESPAAIPVAAAVGGGEGGGGGGEEKEEVVRTKKISPDLTGPEKKFAIATGEPDPLFGFIDAQVSLALRGIAGTQRHAYRKREGDSPQSLREDSPGYAAVLHECEAIKGAEYATIVTRGGEPYSAIFERDGLKEARAHYLSEEIPPAKGLIVGVGGREYDDTLSHAIRLAVGALPGVKKGGEIVLVAECKDGIGSEALQMFLTGRMTESFLNRGTYIEGMEEISYVAALRERYSLTLLSSLPELYVGGKLRFRTARGAGDALGKVFSAVGRGAKLNVITRACETVLPSPSS